MTAGLTSVVVIVACVSPLDVAGVMLDGGAKELPEATDDTAPD